MLASEGNNNNKKSPRVDIREADGGKCSLWKKITRQSTPSLTRLSVCLVSMFLSFCLSVCLVGIDNGHWVATSPPFAFWLYLTPMPPVTSVAGLAGDLVNDLTPTVISCRPPGTLRCWHTCVNVAMLLDGQYDQTKDHRPAATEQDVRPQAANQIEEPSVSTQLAHGRRYMRQITCETSRTFQDRTQIRVLAGGDVHGKIKLRQCRINGHDVRQKYPKPLRPEHRQIMIHPRISYLLLLCHALGHACNQ